MHLEVKGAHVDLSSTAWQEIGVKPGFGLSGIPQHSTRLFVIPNRSGCAVRLSIKQLRCL